MKTFRDYEVREAEGGRYEVSLSTVDEEMVEVFKRLCEEVYGITPHCYLKHRKGEEDSYEVGIYRKEVFYDLWDLGIKGPGHYEFHPPLKKLDEEGKRAYVRGFFSGDGTLAVYGRKSVIRMSSTCKDGLVELREILISLGFHPHEIYEDKHGRERPRYIFDIPTEEHVKFIEEIGSEKKGHKDKFEVVRRLREEIEERRRRK
ncbi:MAG: hypothetical protein FGF51_02620 [Candidatus Brockarchaeota archaeon]|nr:hypothetical protein [Candidatus Brockarchaeota archaeon]